MNYQITSDNIEISESMKALAEDKFSKVEKRLTPKELEEALVRIVLNKAGADDEFRVKIELSYGGKKYFGTETDYSLESALIKATSEVERMRRKDDISYYEDWEARRELKRKAGMVSDEDMAEDYYEKKDSDDSESEKPDDDDFANFVVD